MGKENIELVICRHGEAEQNVGGWYNSNPQHPKYIEAHLTTKGITQARELGEHLKSSGLSAGNVCNVFASPLPRTRESARQVMDVLGIPESNLAIEPGLIESQMGDRESRKIADYGDHDIWFPENPHGYKGESRKEVKDRVIEAFSGIRQQCSDRDRYILLFSHGVPIYLLLEHLTGYGERLQTGGCKWLTVDPAHL